MLECVWECIWCVLGVWCAGSVFGVWLGVFGVCWECLVCDGRVWCAGSVVCAESVCCVMGVGYAGSVLGG